MADAKWNSDKPLALIGGSPEYGQLQISPTDFKFEGSMLPSNFNDTFVDLMISECKGIKIEVEPHGSLITVTAFKHINSTDHADDFAACLPDSVEGIPNKTGDDLYNGTWLIKGSIRREDSSIWYFDLYGRYYAAIWGRYINIPRLRKALNSVGNGYHSIFSTAVINPHSPSKPDGTKPHSISEIIGYCPTVKGGFDGSMDVASVINIPWNLTDYKCTATVYRMPVGATGNQISAGNSVIDMTNKSYSQQVVSLGSWNGAKEITMSSDLGVFWKKRVIANKEEAPIKIISVAPSGFGGNYSFDIVIEAKDNFPSKIYYNTLAYWVNDATGESAGQGGWLPVLGGYAKAEIDVLEGVNTYKNLQIYTGITEIGVDCDTIEFRFGTSQNMGALENIFETWSWQNPRWNL